jgi:peroxiredoxin
LKTEAIPATGNAREILAAKGITFPKGASALWQPEAGELTLINSADNQARLAGLLETDFGGSLGSPTYWLLLADGARLGLAVDKFDQDFVLGHHPVYGRCTVPMSEVCVIRNSPPASTAAMKWLENWRLVMAPEPVLPEAGGESSPLLGQEAAPFKIPLLEGGNFDLSQEKGRVVVLDFWATWCGPCIQSLPGLMEAMAAFPADRVKLIGVDQGEPGDQVKRFLQTRGWKLTVALDASQSVGRQYGVDGIPQTVVIGPDGKVVWVRTGYSPGGETEAADAVKKALGGAVPPADLSKTNPTVAAAALN